MIAEYPKAQSSIAQEVYAELLVGGAGSPFPNGETDLHTAHHLRLVTLEVLGWLGLGLQLSGLPCHSRGWT
jgi:hypothetical protein